MCENIDLYVKINDFFDENPDNVYDVLKLCLQNLIDPDDPNLKEYKCNFIKKILQNTNKIKTFYEITDVLNALRKIK